MEPRPPKRKKYKSNKPSSNLPIIETISGPYKFSAIYDGYSVIINKQSDMEKINSLGSFGKGTLSRNFPTYNKKQLPILRERQCKTYKMYSNELMHNKNSEEKQVLVVNDSDEDDKESVISFTSLLKKLRIPFVEVLRLSLEEAYYLMIKDCLQIKDLSGTLLDNNAVWLLFSKRNSFLQNFIVYNYFRERNWVVKNGLKFGGDYLLYKDGPAYYHASFLVVIDVVTNISKDHYYKLGCKSMEWTSLTCLDRLTETAAKELLIVQLSWPVTLTPSNCLNKSCVDQFSVKPLLMKRWVSKSERTKLITNSRWKNVKNCNSS